MRGINFVALVFASVLVVIPELANAGTLNQVSMTSIDAEQQACADQSRFVVAAAEKDQAPREKELAPSGDVQERAIPRAGLGSRTPVLPGRNSVAPLTKVECTGLKCKAVTDSTCGDVGGLRERCVCSGGGKGLCIDEVK